MYGLHLFLRLEFSASYNSCTKIRHIQCISSPLQELVPISGPLIGIYQTWGNWSGKLIYDLFMSFRHILLWGMTIISNALLLNGRLVHRCFSLTLHFEFFFFCWFHILKYVQEILILTDNCVSYGHLELFTWHTNLAYSIDLQGRI